MSFFKLFDIAQTRCLSLVIVIYTNSFVIEPIYRKLVEQFSSYLSL